jgi:hypothetical protein
MDLMQNFKASLGLTLSNTSGSLTNPKWKESSDIEFTVKHRKVETVVTIPANSSLTLSLTSMGFTQVNFLWLVILEPNKSVVLKFDGDPNGVLVNPPDATRKGFFCAVCNFNSLVIENPSLTDPVAISYLVVEKA